MEHEDSFDVDKYLCIPMSPPSSHMNNTDVAQSSAQAVEALELPYNEELNHLCITHEGLCPPTDEELVRDHLVPAIQSMPESQRSLPGSELVNAHLPSMNPYELHGLAGNNGLREKYYLTDRSDLVLWYDTTFLQLRTPNGFWKKHTGDRGVRGGGNGIIGIKRTVKFHPYTGDDAFSGTNTYWFMNIYFHTNVFVEDGLVLCHVFETDSPDYDDTPQCLISHPGVCNGNHNCQASGAPSNASFNSIHPESSAMHQDPEPPHPESSAMHHDLEPPHPTSWAYTAPENLLYQRMRHGSEDIFGGMFTSFVYQLGNLMRSQLDDPGNSTGSLDTGNCNARMGIPPAANHGHSKKRKKSSDVWDYFTKIFARDKNGKVLTFAACNHCSKILSGSSKGGTTHLARHVCPCKFKPVEAGRNPKD